jgi:uncharacterized membrane protein
MTMRRSAPLALALPDSRLRPFRLLLALALPLLAAAVLSLSGCGNGSTAASGLTVEDGMVKVDAAAVSDGKAHIFSQTVDGKTVRFFVVKSTDGVVRAALDACVACFAAKKGYHQEGEFMVCNNCGQKFHTSKINEIKGGCNPIPLDRVNDGKTVAISLDSLRQGVGYF